MVLKAPWYLIPFTLSFKPKEQLGCLWYLSLKKITTKHQNSNPQNYSNFQPKYLSQPINSFANTDLNIRKACLSSQFSPRYIHFLCMVVHRQRKTADNRFDSLLSCQMISSLYCLFIFLNISDQDTVSSVQD